MSDRSIVVPGAIVAALALHTSVQGADFRDRSFGGNGTVTVRLAREIAGWPQAVAVDREGRIVVAGSWAPVTPPANGEHTAVVRLLPDGNRDAAFGEGDGVTRLARSMSVKDLALYPDGRILLAGTTYAGPGHRGILCRLRADGTLDESFGQGGFSVANIVRQRARWDRSASAREFGFEGEFNAVALAGNRILAAGWAWGNLTPEDQHAPDRWAVLARYDDDGDLDRRYGDPHGEPGFAMEEVQFISGPRGYGALRALPNGGAVVWGRAAPESPFDTNRGAIWSVLTRYDSRGRLNPSFGDGGRLVLHFEYSRHAGSLLVARPDDTAVLVSPTGRVAQFGPNGQVDAAFGTDGEVQLESRTVQAATFHDGGIVAVLSNIGGDAIHLQRLRANGRTEFLTDLTIGAVRPAALTIDGDGRLVLAGSLKICLPANRRPPGYNCERSTDSVFAVVRLRDPRQGAPGPPVVPGGGARRRR